MKLRALGVPAIAASALTVAACGSDNGGGSGSSSSSSSQSKSKPKVGVILPDTASSVRWEQQDRPLLGKAFTAAGVDSDIDEKAIKDAGYTIAADQSVPDWDNTKAGTIFEQMYTKANGKFVGVDSANDGLAGAVVAVLGRNGEAGKIPTTGQDATDEGLQRVLAGTQCMTVYKAIKKEADAASKLAIDLAKGNKSGADALATGSVMDTVTKKPVKSVLLQPETIMANNVKDVVADGFTSASKLCTTAALQKACAKYGVSG
jgi:ABC-type xylose transport system substrate-binding protein